LLLSSFGVSVHDLIIHGDLIEKTDCVYWQAVHRAYKAIPGFPLEFSDKLYLRSQLLNIECPTLWRFNRPKVVVHRHLNGEMAYFLISDQGHLCLNESSSKWFHCFPFISCRDKSIEFNIEKLPHLVLNDEIAWLPQNPNYSHFLCDFFAPWLFFVPNWSSFAHAFKLLQLEPWPKWQTEFIDCLPFMILEIPICKPGFTFVVEPASVLMPICNNPLLGQLKLKEWLSHGSSVASNHFVDPQGNLIDHAEIVFLTRNDSRSPRIKNRRQIEEYVLNRGGSLVDASLLNAVEKKARLASAKYIICEGSGSLNAVLFGQDNAKIIFLADVNILTDKLFLDGGFPYLHSVASRLRFVRGCDCEPLIGSPLSSCSFDIAKIDSFIS